MAPARSHGRAQCAASTTTPAGEKRGRSRGQWVPLEFGLPDIMDAHARRPLLARLRALSLRPALPPSAAAPKHEPAPSEAAAPTPANARKCRQRAEDAWRGSRASSHSRRDKPARRGSGAAIQQRKKRRPVAKWASGTRAGRAPHEQKGANTAKQRLRPRHRLGRPA